MKIQRWGAFAAALSLLSTAVWAEGRTDGPEGSEIGHGGYSRPSNYGWLSIQLDWGAALLNNGSNDGAPLEVGGTLSFWQDDWFLLEVSGEYLDRGHRTDLLVGPRFRAAGWPVALSVGLKAGAIFLPENNVRFGIAPQVGLDLDVHRGILVGLNYAMDIPIDETDLIAHRVFLSLGYRF
jgi:hypothetical protein